MRNDYIAGSTLTKLWYTWKSYALPWRKKYFVGMDLAGNTYWEHRVRIAAHRPRRDRRPRDRRLHWADANADLPPAWHQWLRGTRGDAPSIADQQRDVARRAQLARGAALADARWAAAPSLLNAAPHPPPASVLERDAGLQRRSGVEAGAPRVDAGAASAEGSALPVERTTAPAGMARGRERASREDAAGARNPWSDAEQSGGGFKPDEWDPNAMLPKQKAHR